MYIELSKLSEGRKEFDEILQVNLDDESVLLLEPCRIFGELMKDIVRVDVTGNINARIETECSRCATPVNTGLDIGFKVSYVTTEHYTTEREIELHGEDLEVSIYDGVEIDLADLAREQILLNVPTQTFCQLNCLGLCSKCGANLNQKTCSCETNEIDPRWESLRKFKIKD